MVLVTADSELSYLSISELEKQCKRFHYFLAQENGSPVSRLTPPPFLETRLSIRACAATRYASIFFASLSWSSLFRYSRVRMLKLSPDLFLVFPLA